MKIRISDKEFYTIVLDNDEEISADEFEGFMERLRIVEKILSKGYTHFDNSKKKVHKENNHKERGPRNAYPWINNKEELIKVFKINYYGSKEDKEKVAKEQGKTWEDISKNLFYLRNHGKIVPKDLGLKYFPSLRGKNPNIKQAKINRKDDDYD